MKSKILVVEDELSILNLIKEVLEANNFDVTIATNGQEGLDAFNQNEYNMVITDAMMPIMDGFDMVREIREKDKNIPILMLTALTEEYNELKGFNLGIDDFVAKPFSVMILVKRVEVLLKRQVQTAIYEVLDIKMDCDAYTVSQNDILIELTIKEFAILKFLIENKNRVVSRESILDNVWGYDYYGDVRNVDTHMKNLRKKINLKNLVTVKGVGYNFVD